MPGPWGDGAWGGWAFVERGGKKSTKVSSQRSKIFRSEILKGSSVIDLKW